MPRHEATHWAAIPLASASDAPGRGVTPGAHEYAELKRRVKAAGLMRRQPWPYAATAIALLALIAACMVAYARVDNIAWRCADAVLAAVIFGQLAFLAHDSGHRQVFGSVRNNKRLCLVMTLLLGVSLSWWIDKHNRHHSYPNAQGVDPDIDLPVLAFSEEDALQRRPPWRFVVKYQSFFFVPVLAMEGIGLRLASAQYLARRASRYPAAEPALVALHSLAYLFFVFAFAPPITAIAFILVHHLATGVYLGTIFAPNHKGMALIDDDAPVDFLRRQVLTARNIASHPITDVLYGGQNFQIEHHLFPSMPRRNLRRAQTIIKEFCGERGIPYHETPLLASYSEILTHLHRVSRPLRQARATDPAV